MEETEREVERQHEVRMTALDRDIAAKERRLGVKFQPRMTAEQQFAAAQARSARELGEYEGEWRGTAKHGRGRLVFAENLPWNQQGIASFDGAWCDDCIQHGVMRWSNGDAYEGQFGARFERHGYGSQRWANGDTYVGFWRCDKMSAEDEPPPWPPSLGSSARIPAAATSDLSVSVGALSSAP